MSLPSSQRNSRRSSHPEHSSTQRSYRNSVTLFGNEANRLKAILADKGNGVLTSATVVEGEYLQRSSEQKDEFKPETPVGICSKLLQSLQICYKKSGIKHVLPLALIIGYAFLGGAIFYHLEAHDDLMRLANRTQFIERQKMELLKSILLVKSRNVSKNQTERELNASVLWYVLSLYCHMEEAEYEQRKTLGRNRYVNLKTYTKQLVERCWEITVDTGPEADLARQLNESLSVFGDFTLLSLGTESLWTFWNSMFLAVTIFTTIGYGNIVPKTFHGRLVAIIYAIFGIPLFLMILHRMGRLFLTLLQRLCDLIMYLGDACRLNKHTEKLKNSRIVFETGRGSESYNVPVSLAVGVTFAWLFVCAAIFLKFEPSWDYFTSFYFVFISLTTIGFGDVTPTHAEDMFFTFGFIIIGLSLVSMCVNVVQMKLEHLFEDMMLMMMEEYQSALDSEIEGVGPPPDINGRVGLMAMWKLLNRKKCHFHLYSVEWKL